MENVVEYFIIFFDGNTFSVIQRFTIMGPRSVNTTIYYVRFSLRKYYKHLRFDTAFSQFTTRIDSSLLKYNII